MERKKIPADSIVNDIYLIKAYAGADSKILEYLIEQNAKGIVIEALGRGNLPPKMIPGIEKAIQNDVPVVICSRCPSGRTLDSYGYVGGGKYLTDMGCIMASSLNGQKARILLMLALTRSNNPSFLKELFTV
jgi:L-asparaginase